jgi:hypothetical protein
MNYSKKMTAVTAALPLLLVVGCDLGQATNDSDKKDNAVSVQEDDTSLKSESVAQDTSKATEDAEMDVVATLEDLPNCTSRREGEKRYVSEDKKIFVCADSVWRTVVWADEGTNMYPHKTDSSSGEEGLSSSSVPEANSTEKSSGCFETWNGSDIVYRLETGLDNGSGLSGYWFSYADDSDGGASTIVWPVSPGNEYDPFSFDPIIDVCGGLCGTYILEKGDLAYDPFVGVGFNVAGEKNDVLSLADASSWGGITVTYSSDMVISMELGMGEDIDNQYGFDLPYVLLPKSAAAVTKTFTWAEFKQAGWKGKTISGEEASRILANVRFRIQGRTGSTGKFKIMSVGPADINCSYVSSVLPPVIQSSASVARSSSSIRSSSSTAPKSSSSVPRSSSSVPVSDNVVNCGTFETWHGSDGIYRVETGCTTEMEDGGYWFSYDDAIDGGNSTITWPVPLGNEYDVWAMDPVIDYCQGVCGEFNLDEGNLIYDPFVGVGFNMAGTDRNGELVLADASNMKGVCIAYSSDVAPSLEMWLGDDKDQKLEYDVPYVMLPKSATGVVKEFSWAEFKQAGWGRGETISGEEAAKAIASLKFKIQSKSGLKGRFNIMSIGALGSDCSLVPIVGF